MKTSPMPNLPLDEIRSRYRYNPRTGFLVHATSGIRHQEGEEVGCDKNRNCKWVGIDGAVFKVPNIIWYMHTGNWCEVEAIDGNLKNCRIANLRPKSEPAPEHYLYCTIGANQCAITTNLPDDVKQAISDILEPFTIPR